MAKRSIITLTAANRVGILSAVTNALAELGGDLVEVGQTVVGRHFMIILAVDFPDDRERELIKAHLKDACRGFKMTVTLREPEPTSGDDEEEPEREAWMLKVTAVDQPGMMKLVAARLAQDDVDVTDMHAHRNEDDGAFTAVMGIAVPSGVDAHELKAALRDLGGGVGLGASIRKRGEFSDDTGEHPVYMSRPE